LRERHGRLVRPPVNQGIEHIRQCHQPRGDPDRLADEPIRIAAASSFS
jgi:hypothetical protein